jgi:hypothetical protein
MSKARIGRVMEDGENLMASFTVHVEIDNAKDRKSFKLF